MKEYSTESIRNVALVSHSSAGKTMLAEAFLHISGATTRLGKIEDGTTISDYEEEEIRRGISIYTTSMAIEHKDKKINVLDTPGYTDFTGEVISALRVADCGIALVDSVSGFEVGTEIAWKYCEQFNLPVFLVVNKMDRDNANFEKAMASVADYSEIRLLPLQLPWGEKAEFKGVIDLLSMKALANEGSKEEEIPAELKDDAEAAHLELVEAAAEGDDALLEKYFESGELTASEIISGLRSAIFSRSFVPVFVTSATTETGIIPLLDAIINLAPAPNERPLTVAIDPKENEVELETSDTGPLAAYVWKTTADPYVGKQTFFRVYSGSIQSDSRVWNHTKSEEERLGSIYVTRGKETISVKTVHAGDLGTVPKLSETSTGNTLVDKANPLTLSNPSYPNALFRVAVSPKTQADSTKISPTLTRLCEEDMTLSWFNESSTNQTILQGMGDQHIDVVIKRADSKFQVGLNTKEPKVPFQETITRKATAMYRHKKQTGGAGQFGEVHLNLVPIEGEFEFQNKIFGGAISSSYMTAIEKGIRNAMKDGVIAGYPSAGFRVEVIDGKEHAVDSKPIAFEIAGRGAFKLAFQDAGPVLKEPIMNVKITVPESNMGDVLGDLNTRRARVQGMDSAKGQSIISAQVPLAEMLRYTTQIRSITGGRGIFTMEHSHYEVMPHNIQQAIIAQKQQEDSKDD
ncbi:MAG: elongation factor G [Anaerolineaceae bacterium]|nr:elongation factor G [Anaerolineaceae bacterium]